MIDFFAGIAGKPTGEYVRSALANAAFWGMDLNTVPGLTDFTIEMLDRIDRKGIREAAQSVL